MIKGCSIFGGSKIENTQNLFKTMFIIQVQGKHLQLCGRALCVMSRADCSWTNPLNALQEAIHYTFIEFCVYCFLLWYKFFVHYALRVEKIINMIMMRDLWNFSFFGRGGVSPTHSELCRFVSGSQAKHQVSSPVIILLTKFLSASAITIMSWQDVTRPSLCSGDKKCGTKRAHSFFFPKSSFRMRITAVLGMFKDSAIVLYAI